MELTYYCPKCKKEATPTQGHFQHPHLGTQSCYVCSDCGSMIYPKDTKQPA